MSCLYILEINLLSVPSLASIFSPSKLSFHLMISFVVEKLLSLIRSHLFIFVFIFVTLGGGLKKILLRFMSKGVLPMFSSKNFIYPALHLGLYSVLSLFLCMGHCCPFCILRIG